MPIVDVSATGIALDLDADLLPGTSLEHLKILVDDNPVWEGSAEVVHSSHPDQKQIGCNLLGGILDLDQLHFQCDEIGARLLPELERQRQAEELPTEWRALVAQYTRFFAIARETLERAERAQPDWRRPEISKSICQTVHNLVMPHAHEVARRLVAQAERFDPATRRMAAQFSIPLIQEEYRHGEFLRRAFVKPLGYAGDYWMMELLQMDEIPGETLYGRWLNFAAQVNPMGVSVRKRALLAGKYLDSLCDLGRPIRVMSLACGPAIEMRRLFRERETFDSPVEIFLVDQDEEALRACHRGLLQALSERSDNPPIKIYALHFSLRQLISPRTLAERVMVEETLNGIDFMYSMGLFDYLSQPVARRSLRALHSPLSKDGRLLIGNLMKVPESVWPMEFGADWSLVYRDENDMLDLASGIHPMPQKIDVVRGADYCMFLEVAKD